MHQSRFLWATSPILPAIYTRGCCHGNGRGSKSLYGEKKANIVLNSCPWPPDQSLPRSRSYRLQTRLEKRMEALQRVKLAGYEMVISELEIEMDYLRRATRYLED
jgi:hypothetical protein